MANEEKRNHQRHGNPSNRPNFVFILADDLGYADLHCYGGRAPCSPNLDKLASQGLRFTNGYANSSVCSPSRMAIATGRYQHRIRGGFDEPIASASPALGLPPEHPTMASLLRDAGYATALVGKWHLGSLPWYGPLKSGYQEFFGHRTGAVDFFSHQGLHGHDLWEGDQEVVKEGYLTDLLTDRAVEFVRRQSAKQPFLLSLHYNAPHWPWETREDREESKRIGRRLAHLDGGSVRTYLEMIRLMDEGIGRVLAALDEIGARDDTLVVFTSDNGGERFSDGYPLMGKKMDLLEGGIRVPYIVRWPAKGLPAGTTDDRLAIGMDWTPTFLAAAGVSPHPAYPLDGIDLFGERVERNLYWRMVHRNQKAVRSGVWKYLSIDGAEFLFDLSRDERERANLRYREPEKFEELRRAYFEWDASMPPRPEDAAVALEYTPATMARSDG
ncbi:MAG: sulfatase-like hydrolase/transferase [Pseudomonadota bacterium]|nr:MAG: twin-arginine translocation pathway signal protein [Pseudomonadota bacterium]